MRLGGIFLTLWGMRETTARRVVLVGLFVLSMAVFAAGIDWGLPSPARKAFLFPPDVANSLQSLRLSGAGVDRVAGGWDESADQGSDVASHPLAPSTQPVVLLQNGFSIKEIFDHGDKKMIGLAHAMDVAYQAQSDALGRGTAGAGMTKFNVAYNAAAAKAIAYQHEYNVENIPGFVEAQQEDSVSRARIYRRYMLYSNQPDEMITFRALARMHPGEMQFDPKLYQYGGLWIYPVGGLIKGASAIDLIRLDPDPGFYIDKPEEFAKFYLVARGYSAAWGIVGVFTIFALARRMGAGVGLSAVASLCFIFMPVVVDLAHEAKPHLPGVVLLLLAVLSASRYVETKRIKWIIWTGITCGAAAGMVLSGIVGLALIPVMVIVARDKPARAIGVVISGWVIAAIVYFGTNPYVLIHLVHHDGPLASNLANSRAMYPVGAIGAGLVNALALITVGTSLPLMIVGVIGAIALPVLCCGRCGKKNSGGKNLSEPAVVSSAADDGGESKIAKQAAEARRSNIAMAYAAGEVDSSEVPVARRGFGIGIMLAVIAILVAIEFAVFAAGKAGEYARFAIFVDVSLALAAVMLIKNVIRQSTMQIAVGVLLVAATAAYSAAYIHGFLADASLNNSRLALAGSLKDDLEKITPTGRATMGIFAEPAPYDLPPIDLFRWRLVLLPKDGIASGKSQGTVWPDETVQPDDTVSWWDPRATPISWADKQFDVMRPKG